MTNYLTDKVIIVTGAAAGFGKLVSERAAAMGAKIVASDIDSAGLDTLIAELTTAGHAAVGVQADVSDRQQMKELAAAAVSTFGRIDILLNNAGIMPLAFYADHADAAAAWDKCIDINFRGVLNGITAVHDQMLEQGRGHVINMSSIYGNAPVAGAGVYGATKAAVNFLSESLRVESQGKIKVTIMKPTGVPGTALGAGIINPAALAGILGANYEGYLEKFIAMLGGELDETSTNPESIGYFALAPEFVADQILYAMNQPWGVSIGELTVRSAGESYVI
ncbi:SDR family NAD(P)-dependent oxidoreductase [Halieaceae bacterium IMCC14734]|uniref:SDR family NAD(P)-dependent oxidoreductase n=1 Tax=Candidatus Litorirhabdus singularis TaxID=2518993 RepID=A0ABT3TBC1_9GAMM|nr:SDR family NAD(P)-dependent oxidoreductase [Candidatus Litorirhabdus singularis]MCX2979584.1 SDR family NAD(P)-dependent oxidoreductase [Candidatus Litorirhabdus singularis]